MRPSCIRKGAHMPGNYKMAKLGRKKGSLAPIRYHTSISKCHAPTLSQAQDNRCINPSGLNNTFLELAQGWRINLFTPIFLIYLETISNKIWKTAQKMCIYIYKFKCLQIHNPTDPFYTKKFNTTCIYQEVYYTICFKGKVHTKNLKKIYSSCPAHGIGYTHYWTWGGERKNDE